MRFPSRWLTRVGVLSLGVFALALPAQALILTSEEELVFNEYVTEDVYLAGGNVTIQQDIDGDLFVAGGEVTVNGLVSGDVVVVGGTVLINGSVSDDLRMMGGSLSVNGSIGGDLIAIGGDVDLHPNSVVEGDLLLLGGSVNLYGTVNRSVQGIVGRLTLGGPVQGNVDVRVTEKLVLLRDAQIAGDFTYFAPQKLEDHGGTIQGEILFNEIVSSSDRVKEGLRELFNRGQLVGALWSFLSLWLIGGVLVMFTPYLLQRTNDRLHEAGLASFGVGFLVFVLGGFGFAILLFTVIGVQLAFIGLALLFVLGELGRVVAAFWLGRLVLRGTKESKRSHVKVLSKKHIFGVFTLGLILFKIIGLLPYVGWIAGFVFFLMGAGALVLVQRDNTRRLSKEHLI